MRKSDVNLLSLIYLQSFIEHVVFCHELNEICHIQYFGIGFGLISLMG